MNQFEKPMVGIIVGLFLGWIVILIVTWTRPVYSSVEICDAIYRAEGGAKASYLYGIKSVHYRDVGEAQAICMRTVRRIKKEYLHKWLKGDFIYYLGRTYCPVDTVTWARNVNWFLAHKED